MLITEFNVTFGNMGMSFTLVQTSLKSGPSTPVYASFWILEQTGRRIGIDLAQQIENRWHRIVEKRTLTKL